MGLRRGGYGVTRRKSDPETVAAAGSCVERWWFSAEEFLSARRSVLIEIERESQVAAWLGVVDVHEDDRVVHPSLAGGMQESFQSMPCDRAVFENVPSIILQPKSALVRAVWRCLEEVFGDLTGRG